MAPLHPDSLMPAASVRPEGGSVIDLHCHSLEYSRDSGVSALKIARQARHRGLDAICLTEHDAAWDLERLRIISEQAEIAILPGMEITTEAGHVLVYGLDRYRPELSRIESLTRIVETEGAAMVLAHPMRSLSSGSFLGWDEAADVFHGLEAINGDHSASVQGYYHALATELAMAPTGGSDVHSWQAVGRAVTVFDQRIRVVDRLVEALRARRAAPADLRPRDVHVGK